MFAQKLLLNPSNMMLNPNFFSTFTFSLRTYSHFCENAQVFSIKLQFFERIIMEKWISISDAAKKWGITEQTVRRYCRNGLVPRAFMENHIWFVPSRAKNPVKDGCYRLPSPPLLQKILDQKSSYDRELYSFLQVNMTYSSSRLSSNRLTRNHVEYLFKKNRLLVTNESMKLNDYIEVRNHFLCVDYILEEGMSPLKPAFVIDLHRMLFSDICGHKFRPIKCGEFQTTEAPPNTEYQVFPNEIKPALASLFKRYIL